MLLGWVLFYNFKDQGSVTIILYKSNTLVVYLNTLVDQLEEVDLVCLVGCPCDRFFRCNVIFSSCLMLHN